MSAILASLKSASAILAAILTLTACESLRGIFGETEPLDGYCAAWPMPPIIPSTSDTAATQRQADLVNADWKRRCPNEFEDYTDALKKGVPLDSPDSPDEEAA